MGGLPVSEWGYPIYPIGMALKLAQMAHESGAIVMLGGPEATKDPGAYLAYPQIDVVVHHEGEQTLAALLDLIDARRFSPAALQHELGIAYRDDAGAPVIRQPRRPIDNSIVVFSRVTEFDK